MALPHAFQIVPLSRAHPLPFPFEKKIQHGPPLTKIKVEDKPAVIGNLGLLQSHHLLDLLFRTFGEPMSPE